jgi:hypothetical protein
MTTISSEDTNLRRSVYDADTVDQTIELNKVSWGAIFAGVVVALVVQALLTLLGVGSGIATLDPGTSDNPDGATFSIVAGIWYVVAGIIAAFAGGYISARMSGKIVPTTGALHGLTTWALTTLIVIYLLTSSVGSLVGGVFSGVAGALGGAGQTLAQTAAPMLANSNPLEALESQVRATGTDPDALNAAAMNAMRSLVMGDAASADAARTKAAQALATARGIPLDQATQQVTDMEKQYNDAVESAKQTAIEAADASASFISTGAILAFVALVVGALAGWFGGRSGVVHPIYADRVLPGRRTTHRNVE